MFPTTVAVQRPDFLAHCLCRLLNELVGENLAISKSDGSPVISPFNTLVRYKGLSATIAHSDAKAPDVLVTRDGRFFTHKELTLEFRQWKTGLKDMCDELERALAKYCDGVVLEVSPDTKDDMHSRAHGYSFVNNFKPHVLLEHILQDTTSDVVVLTNDNTVVFHSEFMSSFLNDASHINSLLAMLMYFLPGQTMRSTEFCDGRYRNGSTRRRNVFRSYNATWWITTRTKTESLTGHEAFIPMQ